MAIEHLGIALGKDAWEPLLLLARNMYDMTARPATSGLARLPGALERLQGALEAAARPGDSRTRVVGLATVSLGSELRKRAGRRVAILKITDSAAQLSDWMPRADDANRPIYAHALAFIRSALADLESQGFDPTLSAVFWHQGENETYFAPFRRRYGERLTGLIAALRDDLGRPELPWFLAEESTQAPWGEQAIAEMNEQLRAVAAADSNVTSFATSDLPHERIHFGTVGTVRLGERFAEAYRQWTSHR